LSKSLSNAFGIFVVNPNQKGERDMKKELRKKQIDLFETYHDRVDVLLDELAFVAEKVERAGAGEEAFFGSLVGRMVNNVRGELDALYLDYERGGKAANEQISTRIAKQA
jgi:hypothetical protein